MIDVRKPNGKHVPNNEEEVTKKLQLDFERKFSFIALKKLGNYNPISYKLT